MLFNNINNEFYCSKLLGFNCYIPFISVKEALEKVGANIDHCIDDIYIINNNKVLKDNSLSSSIVTKGLLKKRIGYPQLENDTKNPFFSDLKIPYIHRCRFHTSRKKDAYSFANFLLEQKKSVIVTPTNTLALKAIRSIDSFEKFKIAWDTLSRKNNYLTIEADQRGDVLKIIISNNEILKIYTLVPPYVIGDGFSTIETLYNKLLLYRKGNILYKNHTINNIFSNIDIKRVPKEGEVIKLKDSRRIEFGAMCIDLTEKLKINFQLIVEELNRIIPNISFLEVTCFTEDFVKGLKDDSFLISDLRDSNVDLRYLLSSIESRESLKKIISSIFPFTSVAPSGAIKPECYDTTHFEYSSLAYTLTEAAYQLGLKVTRFERGYQKIEDPNTNKGVLFSYGMSQFTCEIAREITNNKYLTKQILRKNGINTPNGIQFDINDMESAWYKVKKYCVENNRLVLKPLDMQGGIGVSTDISTEGEFIKAWEFCKGIGSRKVIVEEQFQGDDYRIVVIQNNVAAVSQRVAASVIGDGVQNIASLISNKNLLRNKNPFLKNSPITISDSMEYFLSKRGVSINTVPNKNEVIKLCEVANAGMGGDIIDRTDDLHTDWIPIAIQARKVMANAYHVGLDIMMEDISKSPSQQKWAIIEVNTNPDLRVQLFPTHGRPRNIAKILLKTIFNPIQIDTTSYRLDIFGKVQKVGFRKWLKNVCDSRSIVGYVKNAERPDQVEAIISGPRTILKDIIKLCYKGPKLSKVDTITWKECEYINSDFNIKVN